MSSTKKGNPWYSGMKAPIGVDAETGVVHKAVYTTAKVADSRVLDELLHGEEDVILGDKAYTSGERNLLASMKGLDFSGHTGKRELTTEECVL